MDNFYENYFSKNTKRDKNIIDNLYKVPKKDKGSNMPRIQVLRPNEIQQADIPFLPNDEGYKYCLVIHTIN